MTYIPFVSKLNVSKPKNKFIFFSNLKKSEFNLPPKLPENCQLQVAFIKHIYSRFSSLGILNILYPEISLT